MLKAVKTRNRVDVTEASRYKKRIKKEKAVTDKINHLYLCEVIIFILSMIIIKNTISYVFYIL